MRKRGHKKRERRHITRQNKEGIKRQRLDQGTGPQENKASQGREAEAQQAQSEKCIKPLLDDRQGKYLWRLKMEG